MFRAYGSQWMGFAVGRTKVHPYKMYRAYTGARGNALAVERRLPHVLLVAEHNFLRFASYGQIANQDIGINSVFGDN